MLTAGALALAVIAPALDPAEHEAMAAPVTQPATPELVDRPPETGVHPAARPPRDSSQEFQFDAGIDPAVLLDGLRSRRDSVERASRAMPRRALRPGPLPFALRRPAEVTRRPAEVAREAEVTRPAEATRSAIRAIRAAERNAARAAERREAAGRSTGDPARERRATGNQAEESRTVERRAAERPAGRVDRTTIKVQRKRTVFGKRGQARKVARSTGTRDMRAVIAYAKSQVGKRYVRGGEGPHGFDCSGLTKRAFAKAGVSLPHSSGGQARRAKAVARSSARPGDLVVGRGHVGIYMGKGMMIDAGNSRTGVVYRKVYQGLSVSRLH